jgi:hypothetical protein
MFTPLEDPPLPPDPMYADQAAFAAEVALQQACGGFESPSPESECLDEFDLTLRPSRVEQLEWELWSAELLADAEAFLLSERAPEWSTLPPGGALAAALEPVDCGTESPAALIEVMKAAVRLGAWVESVKLDAMASFYRQREAQAELFRPTPDDAETGRAPANGRPDDQLRSAAAEIAAALRLAPTTVMGHIGTAQRLTGPLHDTWSALRCGAITPAKARAVSEAVEHLPVAAQQSVQAKVLPRAPRQTQPQLRAALRRAVAKVDPRDHRRRHRDSLAERACRMRDLPDGMAGIWLTHSADRIQALMIAVKALAERAKTDHPSDRRTAEQRRADAMVDVFEHLLARGTDCLDRPLPEQHRRRPHIEITVPLSTLIGLDEQPADLAGYGPIPSALARRIAAQGSWRRLLTDPVTGVVLEAASTRYRPSAQVSETLLARHPVCDWIGCARPARECDRDHGTKFRDGGRTELGDLRPYCEYHHLIKDNPHWGWSVTNHPDGRTTYIAPTGHRYETVPPDRGPVDPPPSPEDPPPF